MLFLSPYLLLLNLHCKADLFKTTPRNIPAESFEVYGVALALVAQAVVAKKPDHIKDADNLFQELQQMKVTGLGYSLSVYSDKQNHEIVFALERGLCSLLVGEIDECRSWLGLDSENSPYRDPSIANFVIENSKDDKENDLLPGLCKVLELWLMNVVFPRFRETSNIMFKLGDYYDDPAVLRYLESLERVGRSPLAAAAAIVRLGAEATAVLDSVKDGALQALQKVFPLGHGDTTVRHQSEGLISAAVAVEINEPGVHNDPDDFASIGGGSEEKISDDTEQELITFQIKDASVKIMCAGVVVGLLTLAGLKYLPYRNSSVIPRKDTGSAMASDVIDTGKIF